MFSDDNIFFDILTGKNNYNMEDQEKLKIRNNSILLVNKYMSIIEPIKDEFLTIQKQIPQDRILDFKDIFMSVYNPLNDFYNYVEKNRYTAKEPVLQRFYIIIYKCFTNFKKMFEKGETRLNLDSNFSEGEIELKPDSSFFERKEKQKKQVEQNYKSKLEELMEKLKIDLGNTDFKIQNTNHKIKFDPKNTNIKIVNCPTNINEDVEMENAIPNNIKIQEEEEEEEEEEWYNKSNFNYSVSDKIGNLEIQVNRVNSVYRFIYSFNYENAFSKIIKKDYQAVNNYFEKFKLEPVWNINELSFVQKIENEYSQFTNAFNYLRFLMTHELDFIQFVEDKPKKIKRGIIEVQRFINNMKESYSDVHDFKDIFKTIFSNYLKHEFVEKNSLDHLLIYYPLDKLKKIYYEPEIWKIENYSFD